MEYIYDGLGIRYKTSNLLSVERLFKLKEKSGSNPWPVIEECLKIWVETNPTQYNSFLVDVTDMKQTRRNKFASSKTEMYRYTLDLPEKVYHMIRCIYSVEELPMDDKRFFREWAKRFPTMKVAEKI